MVETVAQAKEVRLSLPKIIEMIKEYARVTGHAPGPMDFGHADVQTSASSNGARPPLPPLTDIRRALSLGSEESSYNFAMRAADYSDKEIEQIQRNSLSGPRRYTSEKRGTSYKKAAPVQVANDAPVADVVQLPTTEPETKPEPREETPLATVLTILPAQEPASKPVEPPAPKKTKWPEYVPPPRPPKPKPPPPADPNAVQALKTKEGWGDPPQTTKKPDSK